MQIGFRNFLNRRNLIFVLLLVLSLLSFRWWSNSTTASTTHLILANDVVAGQELSQTDLQTIELSGPLSSSPTSTAADFVGKTMKLALPADTLIRSEFVTENADQRIVSFPVKSGNLPNLNSGDLVEVWLTPSSDSLESLTSTRMLLSDVVVDQVPDLTEISSDVVVSVLVAASQVEDLVAATNFGDVHLVGIR